MNSSLFSLSLTAVFFGFLFLSHSTVDASLRKTKGRRLQSSAVDVDPHLDNEFRSYRFLALGTSRTWGTGLDDRKKTAYPWLLSETATNLGIRAAGPDIPALCAQTLVGDNIYDVIVMEFFFQVNKNFIRLAGRLRQRFPKATFVFIVAWSPFQFIYRKDGPHKNKSLKVIMEELAPQTQGEYEKVLGEFVNATENSDWAYFYLPRAKMDVEKAIRVSDGIVVSQQLDPDNVKPYLLDFAHLFVPDAVHWSVSGHRWARNAVINMLRQVKAKQSDEVNDWDGRDICNNLYQDGSTTGLIYDTSTLFVNEFKPEKFALELRNAESTWLKVDNDMPVDAELYISYMSMGPASTKYPTVLASVTGMVDGDNFTMVIEPFEKDYTYPVHVVKQVFLGRVKPGTSPTISLTVTKPGEWPFRVTGLILTPTFRVDMEKFEWDPRRPPLDSYVPAVERGLEWKDAYTPIS